jgi:outer membrane protein assembly factor BamE (lipoprotein component of BamABCDE complex)
MGHQFAALVSVVMILGACAQPGGGYFRSDLNDDITARVTRGQSEQEVTALLGAPFNRMRFDNLKSTAWDYLYRDSWGYWVEFSVMIGEDGRVAGKVSKRIDPVDR